MTPLSFRFILFTCLFPSVALAQSRPAMDSLQILNQTSRAHSLFLVEPDSAIELASSSLIPALQIRSSYLSGFSYYVLSKAYWTKANYKLSAEFGFKALKAFECTSYVKLWGKSLLSLGRTFVDLQNYEQGRTYIQKAFELGTSQKDEYLIAESYREKSMLLSETKKLDSALIYSDKGIALFEKYNDSISVSILISRKAKIYYQLKNFALSKSLNKTSLQYDLHLRNNRALGISYYQCAVDAAHERKYDSAIALLQKSLPIINALGNITALIKVHELLGKIYYARKERESAITQLMLASQLKDSLYNVQKSGQIQEMQSLYELSSKEHTIKTLEQDNLLKAQQMKFQWLFVAFLLLCMLFLGLTVYSSRRYHEFQRKTNQELAQKNTSIEQQKEEIKAQAESLQQISDLKSKLFSVISHDLRGPMASLHSFLELLVGSNLTPQEFISISEKLKSSLDITQRTLDNLLNWSLSQMKGLKTDPIAVNVHETVREACNLLDEVARAKNVTLETNVDQSLHAKADADQVQLILRNLLHNAIKFSKPYHCVSVSARKDRDYCFVSVKDSGIGMTKTEIETVTSSRHHFSKTGTMQEKGTGLGLLLCQEFIKLNGGSLEITSNLHSGTEVIFSLPLTFETELASS